MIYWNIKIYYYEVEKKMYDETVSLNNILSFEKLI